jgi:RND family efflux transporter MFP subunit
MTTRIVCAAAFALVACRGGDEAEHESTPVVRVQTIVVAPQPFTETLGTIGSVVTRAGHVATLSAPVAARVERVSVTTGQRVQRGQTLVELDQGPFQTSLRAAQAGYTAAERAYERQQRLAAEGIVPKKDAEAASAELARARAEVEAARRSSQLSVLRSPISGVVTRMNATLGATVDPAQPLVEVSDPGAVDVLLMATPTDAARVRVGAKAALSAGSTASGESLGIGSVVDIAGAVDSASRGVAIRVQAPTTRRPLKIGETVFGAIAIATRTDAIVIPNEAIVPDGEHFKVFVVDAQGIAHEREVKVGGKNEKGVEITEGLTAGERIVTYGAYGVTDSAKVETPAPAKP